MIELDFISVVIGYVVGVFLTWSLTFTLYGCDNNEEGTSNNNSRFYFWHDISSNDTYDRRIM
jgi:hypothetical protein